MAEGKIKVFIKRPDEKYGHVAHISSSLENLQKTVGGYIETLALPGFNLILNEEGAINEMPYNCHVLGFTLFGTIIAAGFDGEDFADVGIPFDYWKTIIDESNGGRV